MLPLSNIYKLTQMIWQSVNFGRKILICTCPQQRSRFFFFFFFCLISLSPLFKLLHVKVYHPLAVPQHKACCWRATSETSTHNNIKKRLLLLLSQESYSALGVGGSITAFRNHRGVQNAIQIPVRTYFHLVEIYSFLSLLKRLLFTYSLIPLKCL